MMQEWYAGIGFLLNVIANTSTPKNFLWMGSRGPSAWFLINTGLLLFGTIAFDVLNESAQRILFVVGLAYLAAATAAALCLPQEFNNRPLLLRKVFGIEPRGRSTGDSDD